MRYSTCLFVLFLGTIESSITGPLNPTECVMVDVLDTAGHIHCASGIVFPPVKIHSENIIELQQPIWVENKESAEDASECQEVDSFITWNLPLLLQCTIRSQAWSREGEPIYDMQHLLLRLVEELNASRVAEVEQNFNREHNVMPSSLECTFHKRAVHTALDECFLTSGSCRKRLESTFLCLTNKAFELLDSEKRKSLACQLLKILREPIGDQSWQYLINIRTHIDALCPEWRFPSIQVPITKPEALLEN
ncbi:uncharacterized protein LOC144141416 [Haemaphysalis longicornis]